MEKELHYSGRHRLVSLTVLNRYIFVPIAFDKVLRGPVALYFYIGYDDWGTLRPVALKFGIVGIIVTESGDLVCVSLPAVLLLGTDVHVSHDKRS